MVENLVVSFFTSIVTLFNLWFGNFTAELKPEPYSPCSPPVRYQIGSIDKHFGLTEKALLADLSQSQGIWEVSYEKNLFVYDPEGTISLSKRLITINLVYDDRQQLNSKVKQLEGSVSNENKQMQASIADYEVRIKVLNERSAALSEKMRNLDIKDPEYSRKFDEVFQESKAINQEYESLNQLASTLNQSTQSYNREVGKLNKTINDFNQTLAEKPEEGLYNPEDDTIDIYMNNSKNERIHTLAHELGHALGIDHTADPKSIMYKSTSQYIKVTGDDMNGLQEACKVRT